MKKIISLVYFYSYKFFYSIHFAYITFLHVSFDEIISITEQLKLQLIQLKEQKIKREFVASLQLKLFFKQQTIIEQILKITQNYPIISKTASSDAPFFIKA